MLQLQLLLLLKFGLLAVLGGPVGAVGKVAEHQWAAGQSGSQWESRLPFKSASQHHLFDHHPRTTAFVHWLVFSPLNYCQFLHGFFYF